jgi:hypothetical protein
VKNDIKLCLSHKLIMKTIEGRDQLRQDAGLGRGRETAESVLICRGTGFLTESLLAPANQVV